MYSEYPKLGVSIISRGIFPHDYPSKHQKQERGPELVRHLAKCIGGGIENLNVTRQVLLSPVCAVVHKLKTHLVVIFKVGGCSVHVKTQSHVQFQ
jgi:hypothetical protein